jgi:hypothetical protein
MFCRLRRIPFLQAPGISNWLESMQQQLQEDGSRAHCSKRRKSLTFWPGG